MNQSKLFATRGHLVISNIKILSNFNIGKVEFKLLSGIVTDIGEDELSSRRPDGVELAQEVVFSLPACLGNITADHMMLRYSCLLGLKE